MATKEVEFEMEVEFDMEAEFAADYMADITDSTRTKDIVFKAILDSAIR